MKVYRIEHADKEIGPFRFDWKNANPYNSNAFSEWLYHEIDDNSHPIPDMSLFKRGEVFGCLSLAQITDWFPPKILKVLHRESFRVVKFNVKTVKHDYLRTQVCFMRDNAEVLEYIPLSDIP